ncbi:mannonate hydrolase [Bacteroidales bacterium]|nr:mannonate hydrolase [Bacteroidales bacterium]
MALEKTWRWFGVKDSVSLSDLQQIGIEGVVTSLYDIAPGEVWPVDTIRKLQTHIEAHGMRWSVVESLPISEGLKTCSHDRPRLIQNYIQSLHNLASCGIDTICYNFMPVLDWARTDLHFTTAEGGESMLFDLPTFAAFDMFILKRPKAEVDYHYDIIHKAKEIIQALSEEQKEELAHNIIVITQAFIHGLVGEGDDYKAQFLNYLSTYKDIGKEELRDHLSLFLQDIIPVAEKLGINMCIHPDDPPFPLLGLPRIASTVEDFRWIMSCYDSPSNGITFCVGSLSARSDNDLCAMAKEFAPKIHFIHLRNTTYLEDGSFYESGQIKGSANMFAIVKILLEEQMRRTKEGRKDLRMPFRPDHGIRILDDFKRTANPGYPLIGRLKGLAEIDGLQTGIEGMLLTKPNNH